VGKPMTDLVRAMAALLIGLLGMLLYWRCAC
jgi:hypothetical protein